MQTKEKLALGIDIGGTNTKIGIVTSKGELLDFYKFPTQAPASFEEFAKETKLACDRLLSAKGLDYGDILAVGVGAPNGNFKTGRIESPTNLKKWGTVDLKGRFQKLFGLDIHLDNDANVAALGEGKWGVCQGMEDYIVATLGTGIGTGVVCSGQIARGGNGMAGEGGHIIIEPGGRDCGCGGEGHLEVYASVRGIKLTVKEMLNKEMTFAEISAAYREDDPKIHEVFEITAKYLGRGLAAMVSLMAPQAIVLAGGVATIGEKWREQTELAMNEAVYPPFRGQTKVLLSEISTGEGAVMGAASLVF